MEKQTQAHSRHRQRSGRPSHNHNYNDGGADKPDTGTGIGTDTADTDTDKGIDPGIKQIQTEEQTTQAQSQTQGQAVTASDGKVNKDTRRPKLISFSINNISDHFEKLTNDRTDKKMIELVKKMTE